MTVANTDTTNLLSQLTLMLHEALVVHMVIHSFTSESENAVLFSCVVIFFCDIEETFLNVIRHIYEGMRNAGGGPICAVMSSNPGNPNAPSPIYESISYVWYRILSSERGIVLVIRNRDENRQAESRPTQGLGNCHLILNGTCRKVICKSYSTLFVESPGHGTLDLVGCNDDFGPSW